MERKYRQGGRELTVNGVTEERQDHTTAADLLFYAITGGIGFVADQLAGYGGSGHSYKVTVHTDRGDFSGVGDTPEEARRRAEEEVYRNTGFRIQI
jgi:hypothetical protein